MSDAPTAQRQGIIAQEEQAVVDAINTALPALGLSAGFKPIELRALPFEGTWGSATMIARMVASDLVSQELEASGELEGLSKKEAKKKVNALVAPRAQEIAEQVATEVAKTGRFVNVEAVNGYINVTYDANQMASRLIGEVLSRAETYGHAEPDSQGERVMIEHSQLNTHKAAHVGHLRNICLGVAVTNITRAGGFTTIPVTYIGDIGRHVISCLWCYDSFHRGSEPEGGARKGQWLGDIYAEADRRLSFRKDTLGFLNRLITEDEALSEEIDRLLKELFRTGADGEDIAYLLGRVTNKAPVEVPDLRDANIIVDFWPILGGYLRTQVASEPEETPAATEETSDEPVQSPAERFEEWEKLNEHMADWWPNVPAWEQEVKDLFQKWEAKDPEFVALWEQTREWSLTDLRRIFDEFDATFDVWFSESGVEDAGRRFVGELLERGIAEISDGLPVVKIDEKLGLETETYRTMPILRSDGTTLYSTKDLALTQQKFVEYNVDRSVWVVDVRQSLYFDQISKILELSGFPQAANSTHLGYEFVTLPTGVMSSRKGDAPMLEDVRDTMMDRALAVIREKNPELPEDQQADVARQVAIGSIKYMMLARDSNKVIVFDPEEALSFDGHAAPYIQYAHARACRILEHEGATDADLLTKATALDFGQAAPEELELLQAIGQFPETLERAATEQRPLHITNYVFDLAKRFNDFYHACPVRQSEEPIRTARLALVTATRTTLRNGLALLGVEAPTMM